MTTDTHTFYTAVFNRTTGVRTIFWGLNHHQRAIAFIGA